MKRHLLTILFLFLGTALLAQSPVTNVTIKGIVVDSAANKPMDFVTVALQDINTKLPVKSTLTKTDGSFEITAKKGQYNMVLAFMGYANKIIPLDSTLASINLGSIRFSATSKQLNEVQITGVKPLMKQEVDRISYDVQADPESKIVTALDMMRKVPMVSVDGEDNIKLRGSGSYKILINGKESALMTRNPSDVLRAMPGTNIVKIEVITTPPAKYDAEGLAGIINIITQKNGDEGYNMAFNTGYNSVWGYRGNVSATVKQGKFGFNGYAGANKRPEISNPFYNSTYFTNPAPVASIVQNGRQYNSRKSAYANADLSFEADSLNLITASFNYYNGDRTDRNEQFTEARNSSNDLTTKYTAFNRGTGDFNGTDVGINYQLGFKRSKEQLLTVSYKYSRADDKVFNDITSNQELNYSVPDYRQYNKSGSKEHTTQLDYVHPFKNITIEGGGKIINRSNISNFYTDTLATIGEYNTDATQVNNFNYKQDVYGVYNSYTIKLTKWTFKGGLRYERTVIDDGATTAKSAIDQNYANLVPSLSVQRT
ncbi:MAG: TonB-dependent receptor, partial [Sphingobacteriales bacterium]